MFHFFNVLIVWLLPRKGIYHLLSKKEKLNSCLDFLKFQKGDENM